ncbi:MAG: LacI family DNA-binding transcriptional regulator [Bacillota bacterium]
MKPTIKSIAEAANVSRGTVDKVLNDRPGVSQEVRERVKKIAEEMGYQPNLAGKVLAFQKKPLKIGVIILNKEDPFFQEIYKGVQEAQQEFKDFGVSVEIRMMENITAEEQVRCITELQRENITALALSPLEEESVKAALKEVQNKNIRVIAFNTDITDVEKLCFVGQNLIRSGRVAGELMGKVLPAGGKVAVLTSLAKIKALKERVEGFKQIVETEYPSLEVIELKENIWNNEAAYVKTLELLKEHPDLKGIYITGRGIEGVGKALDQLDRKEIKFICFDMAEETVNLIKKKIVDFTITQEPFDQGYLPIKILFDYFYKNQEPSSQQVYTKLQIITKENIET